MWSKFTKQASEAYNSTAASISKQAEKVGIKAAEPTGPKPQAQAQLDVDDDEFAPRTGAGGSAAGSAADGPLPSRPVVDAGEDEPDST